MLQRLDEHGKRFSIYVILMRSRFNVYALKLGKTFQGWNTRNDDSSRNHWQIRWMKLPCVGASSTRFQLSPGASLRDAKNRDENWNESNRRRESGVSSFAFRLRGRLRANSIWSKRSITEMAVTAGGRDKATTCTHVSSRNVGIRAFRAYNPGAIQCIRRNTT